MRHYLLLCVSLIFFGSCMIYKDVELVGVKNVKLNQFSLKGIEAEVSLRVKNPNGYKITIVDSDLDIILNGKPFGKAKIKENVVLKKKSDEVHKITIKSKVGSVAQGALSSLLGLLTQKAVNVRLKGDIKAKALVISKKIPIDIEEKVSL